jgi:hypothetical protein
MGEPQWPSDAQLISTAARLNKPIQQSSPGPRTAELCNGRAAMLGFVIGLATEALTGQGILHQIGLGSLLSQG